MSRLRRHTRRLLPLTLICCWLRVNAYGHDAKVSSRPECEFAAQLAASAAHGDGTHGAHQDKDAAQSVSWVEWTHWMEAYSSFHDRVVAGVCPPRYLVFKASGVKGLGDQMLAISATMLAAMVSDRAMLIHWRNPVPLTEYMVPTIFNWDAREILPLLSPDVLQSAIELSSEEHCEDLTSLHNHHPLIIHSPHHTRSAPCAPSSFQTDSTTRAWTRTMPKVKCYVSCRCCFPGRRASTTL